MRGAIMSIIPPEPKREPKRTLSIRLSTKALALLEQYCQFAKCGRQHVVEQSLLYTFEQDAAFQRWLAK